MPRPPAESYTFSAKEKDVETGLSYFGSRYYSSDLSIWLSVDPMATKYASLSPYVYCYNNPILVYDPNGEEGITISGSPGNHGNKLHFLINGLNRAVQAKKHFQRKNETSTWIIYNDAKSGYTPELIKHYSDEAKKEGVNVIVVTDVKEIITYINKKDGNNSRYDDKITSFYYVGHATPGDLDVGYAGTGQNFDPSDLSPNAFSSGAYVDVVGGCRTAVPWLVFLEKSVVDQFAKILDKKSEIYGSDVRVQYNGGVMTNQQLLKESNGTVVSKKGERD